MQALRVQLTLKARLQHSSFKGENSQHLLKTGANIKQNNQNLPKIGSDIFKNMLKTY